MKVKTIRIYHDTKMFISDWVIFLLGGGLVILFLSSMINVIGVMESESNKMLALIILMFALIKLVNWVRMPIHYRTRDLIEDIRNP